ncbi:MAG: hypothetical protein ACLPN1_00145, partial [Dissulfurispiraceae bacterium]
MACPYFKSLHNIGVCSASSNNYMPGLDEMSLLCFKESFHNCTIFRECISELSIPQSSARETSGNEER